MIADIPQGTALGSHKFTRSRPLSQQKSQTKPLKRVRRPKPQPKVGEWDLFLMHVRKYRKTDFRRFVRDKKIFDDHLSQQNFISQSQVNLFGDYHTKIVQDSAVINTENLTRVTVARNTELYDAPNQAADKALEEQFRALITNYSTYCVGAPNPIEESYEELVEALRAFDEKFGDSESSGIEMFIRQFLGTRKLKSADAMNKLLNVRYGSVDKLTLRARTFLTACFNTDESSDVEKNEYVINQLLQIVRKANEEKQKKLLEPQRFAQEVVFNHLIQDIEIAAINERQPLSADDKHFIERLEWHKKKNWRDYDIFMWQVFGKTKEDLMRQTATERMLLRPPAFDKIQPAPPDPAKGKQIEAAMLAAYERHLNKPLSQKE
jgi:hypothetical protein